MAECEQNPERCSICDYSGCNYDYILRNPRIWCVQCDRTPDCMWSFRTPTKSCNNQVAFYETESCYQHLYPNGLSAKRGCTLDDPELCQQGGDSCQTCSSYFCNGATYLTQKCIRCTSTDSELCEERADQIEGDTCIVDPTHAQRGCYSFRDELGTVFRGCYFDMEVEWADNCTTTYKDRCTRCYGLNCNTNYQGGGDSLNPIKLVMMLPMMSLLWWSNGN